LKGEPVENLGLPIGSVQKNKIAKKRTAEQIVDDTLVELLNITHFENAWDELDSIAQNNLKDRIEEKVTQRLNSLL